MRSMMLGMTGLAVLLGVVVAVPFASGILLGGLWLAASGWLITGIVFAKDDARAFCIGAAVVVASTWTGMGGQFLESIQRLAMSIVPFDPFGPSPSLPGSVVMWFKHLALIAAAIANGWLCIRARRYFEQRAED